MSKIEHSVSDIFVKKLSEKMWKIMRRDDIYDIWLASGGAKARFAAALTRVKYTGYISSLGGWLYHIWQGDLDMDSHYAQIVSLLIREHAPSGAIIAHEKSLEYHLRNYEIPPLLVLYTRDIDKRVRVGKYAFHFRTRKTGEKTGTKNMYRIYQESSMDISVDEVRLKILWLEASLLDVLSLRVHESGIEEALVLRFLEKYHKKLSREILGELVAHRYIRALNRLRSLAKEHGYMDVYTMTLDIIRREGGGCYLHL